MNGWISPRLGVRFELIDGQLRIYGPDQQPFVPASESKRQAREQQRQAEEQRRRAERLAAQLKALGIEPET